jgi:predicted RNase H-like nuclease
MFVAGVDGCSRGWVWIRVDVPSMVCSVDRVDLCAILKNRPVELLCLAIDIPIGLLNGSRACDSAARKLLGYPRASSVFSPPCRLAAHAQSYTKACDANFIQTGKRLSRQSWGIAKKICDVDGAMTVKTQQWAFEVHPEVSFWALNHRRPMSNRKKSKDGKLERRQALQTMFANIEEILQCDLSGVKADDVLDAAAAAWTAIRLWQGIACSVCEPEFDERKLRAAIHY